MSLVSSSTLDQGFEVPRRYLAAAAILIGVLMAALDSSIVNIALPMRRDTKNAKTGQRKHEKAIFRTLCVKPPKSDGFLNMI
ncbi:hypothetical protein ACQSGE_25710 [Salmonella enterica]|uniref:hypothetical protein n=1 Tax=Salmonella enterica TaxID=28901 RepID=UPI003D31AE60